MATTTSFADQLRDMWRTRPVRLPRQGPLAGVAAGFGQRYQVDPVLVRVAFVVSTIFGGAGLALYLFAWLVCRCPGDETSAAGSLAGRGTSSVSQAKTIGLVIGLMIIASSVGTVGVGLGGSGLIGLAFLLGGWWMLHLRTPEPPALPAAPLQEELNVTATGYPGTSFPPTGGVSSPLHPYGPYTTLPEHYEPDPAPSAGESGASEQIAETSAPDTEKVALAKPSAPRDAAPNPQASEPPGPHGGSTNSSTGQPPSWDPLGVAPLAWDLPEPQPTRPPARPPAPRTRSRLTPVVLGLAILAAGGAGAAAAAGVSSMTPARIAAVALGVLGMGLLLGAFRRRGYGLLLVAAPLAGFVFLASLVGPMDFRNAALGEVTWAPDTPAELASDYRVALGSGTLDLRSMTLTEDRSVDLDVRLGEAVILVPDSMTLRAECVARMGETQCPTGLDGPGGDAPVLDLSVDVRAGSVEVRRG